MIITKTECPTCGATFPVEKILELAKKDEDGDVCWSCPECGSEFYSPGNDHWRVFEFGIPDDEEPAQVQTIEVDENEW